MSGRFSKLNVSDEARQRLWDKNANKIRSLLEEIVADVCDGKGEIGETQNGFYGMNGFSKPMIAANDLGIGGAIGVCAISASMLIVGVYKYNGPQSGAIECVPEDLEGALESAVKFLVKK